MKTHDYTKRYFGHDYTWDPDKSGLTGTAIGWGRGIKQGDLLLFPNPQSESGLAPYRVREISYMRDPPDMWKAKLLFVSGER